MNRFVKQNLLLISVMGISGVVILALLIYSAIVYFQMSQCISETETLREQIRKLISQRPAPVEGNKPLLQKDIDLYTKLNTELSAAIGHPYKKAGERFIEILKNVKKDGSIEEARKEFIEEYNSTVGIDEKPARQGMALEEMRRKYRATWRPALREFLKLVAPLTQEPDLERDGEAFAFAAIGIPRKMQNNPEKVMDYCRKYQAKINQLMGQRMRTEADSLGFSFIENPAKTFEVEGSEGGPVKAAFRVEDIPLITRHWDIIGDICKRISTVEIQTLNFFHIRGINAENGAYDGTVTSRGNYQVYHYSFEVTSSMENLRKLVKAFNYDPATKRLYIIRSIFVYASDVELAAARFLLNPQLAQQEAEKAEKTEKSAVSGRRGRRRGAAPVEEPQQGTVVAAGPGKKDEPMEVKVGDVVIYGKYAGTDVSVDGKDYLIMKQSDILAIL